MPDRQGVPCVQVISAVKHRLTRLKYFSICMNHRFYNFPINFPRTFIRLYANVIVMYIATWHTNLKMISSQTDRSTFSSYVWSSRARKHCKEYNNCLYKIDFSLISSYLFSELELDILTWQFCRLRRSVCLLCGNKPHVARSCDTTRRYSRCPNRTATS